MKVVLLISLILTSFACSAFAILSPGYGVGTTDFDWLRNGSLGKDVVLDDQHGVHVYWTFRTGGDPNNRRSYYNFKDETGNWVFAHRGTGVDGRVSGMGSLAVLSDGRACVAAHASSIGTRVWVDAARGAGVFSGPYEVDPNNPAYPIWPTIARGGNNVLHVNSVTNGQPNHYYSRSTDLGQTWSTWFQLCDDGLGGGWNTLTAQGSKVGWVYPDINYQLYYRESTDAGSNWGAKTLIDPGDTTISRLFQDALYGPTGELHVVYDVADTQSTKPPSASQIRHWSPSTGVSLVRSGWWESRPGANHGSVACPQLGYNARNNTWWCTWVEFTLADTSTEGFSNGEIWAAYSDDNGRTWRAHRNITNSPTPGAPPGQCADDRYASLPAVLDDEFGVFYLSSFAAGSSIIDGTTLTQDTMRYYQFQVGVDEQAQVRPGFTVEGFRISPNPTRGRTVISFSLPYPLLERSGNPDLSGHPTPYTLSLYDLSGRRVKSFSPHALRLTPHEVVWDGRDDQGRFLPSGVYFVQLQAEGRSIQNRLLLIR